MSSDVTAEFLDQRLKDLEMNKNKTDKPDNLEIKLKDEIQSAFDDILAKLGIYFTHLQLRLDIYFRDKTP